MSSSNRELKGNDRFFVLLDPLSHGDNMLSCLVEYEAIRVDPAVVSNSAENEVELEIEVAVLRVISAITTEYGNENVPSPDDGSWRPEKMVGQIWTIVRACDQSWQHVLLNNEVDFVDKLIPEPEVVDKSELKSIGMVGPIAEGETPLDAIRRMEKQFGRTCLRYAYRSYDSPKRGENQQFPVIVGAVWSEQ